MNTTFVLRYRQQDGHFAVAAIDLPQGTSLEEATEIAFEQGQDQGLLLEQITNADTKESGRLGGRKVARGFA